MAPESREYRFWAFDLVTRTPLGQVPLGQCTCTTTLNTPGQFQANLYPAQALGLNTRAPYSQALTALGSDLANSVMDRILVATTPGKTIIVPEWNGYVCGAWKVEQRVYNSSASNQPASWQIQGSELLNHYNLRTYRGDATGQSTVANDALVPVPVNVDMVTGTLYSLLTYCNDINLDLSGLQPSGFIDSEAYDPTVRNTILTLINDLCQQDVGPDIWIQASWATPGVRIPNLKVIAQGRIGLSYQNNPDTVPRIRYPFDIYSYSITEDGTQSYSTVDELTQNAAGTTVIASAYNPDLIANGWPETDFAFDRTGGLNGVVQQVAPATLQAWANADAALFDGPVKIGTYVCKPESVLGKINPGDDIRVTIKDYPLPWGVDLYQRCIGLQYDFDNRQITIQIDGSTGWSFSDTAHPVVSPSGG